MSILECQKINRNYDNGMKWIKKGLIYSADGRKVWKKEFAMLPTPLLVENKLRIFLGMCDENNVGSIGYIDVNPNNPADIFEVSEKPVLERGRDGCFDDNGVVPVSIIEHMGKIYLYYIGFQLGVKVPYYMFCGLAISRDGGMSFERYSESPILDRRGSEVFARCGVNVIYDRGKFRMWYIGSSENGWTNSGGKKRPCYVMRYTESDDGIRWNNDSLLCMNFANEDEHGFGRPYVWREGEMLKMYYSIRTYSRGYYIGYAESFNGIDWNRLDDKAGIELSSCGWDDTNLSYPYLFRYNHKTYMFYNGNGCGKTGVGYAVLETDGCMR